MCDALEQPPPDVAVSLDPLLSVLPAIVLNLVREIVEKIDRKREGTPCLAMFVAAFSGFHRCSIIMSEEYGVPVAIARGEYGNAVYVCFLDSQRRLVDLGLTRVHYGTIKEP